MEQDHGTTGEPTDRTQPFVLALARVIEDGRSMIIAGGPRSGTTGLHTRVVREVRARPRQDRAEPLVVADVTSLNAAALLSIAMEGRHAVIATMDAGSIYECEALLAERTGSGLPDMAQEDRIEAIRAAFCLVQMGRTRSGEQLIVDVRMHIPAADRSRRWR